MTYTSHTFQVLQAELAPAQVPPKSESADRTREYLARMKGEETRLEDFAEPETLTFQPLPCWSHLSPEAYRARIAAIVEEIEADAAAQRERTGRRPLGAEMIRRQEPTTQPNRIKKSPAPRFHAFTKRVRRELYRAYSWFVSAFREAAEKLRQGGPPCTVSPRMLPASPALCP